MTTVIVGAGPLGRSIAAHRSQAGVPFRIFGTPLSRWRDHMPAGMFLKSEGFASNLAEPTKQCTLRKFCGEHELPYENGPISLDAFTRYALAFQKLLVPSVEDVQVIRVGRAAHGFVLRLAQGEEFEAENIIVATGLSHTAHLPRELGRLSSAALSHSGDHRDLSGFKGQDVIVIGAGQSALETAALLHESGAVATLMVRRSALEWNEFPSTTSRSMWERVRRPHSALGDGLKNWLCADAPAIIHRLPQRTRIDLVRNVLGPAGAWWLRERIIDRVPIMLGHTVVDAEMRGDRAMLRIVGPRKTVESLAADHVVAATGYRFDLRLLPFLSEDLKAGIRCVQAAPVLSAAFMSSVPALYFCGLASAYSFGPAMRFLHGAHYAAPRIARDIAARQGKERTFAWSAMRTGARQAA